MTFRVTARDNRMGGGAFQTDDVNIVVIDTAGPLALTSPDTAVTWQGGSSQTVNWDNNNTNLPPISCVNLSILLSEDGGQTFPHVLSALAANNGSKTVTVPQIDTAQARVKIACNGHIIFDLSSVDFTIEGATDIFADGFESGNVSMWSASVP